MTFKITRHFKDGSETDYIRRDVLSKMIVVSGNLGIGTRSSCYIAVCNLQIPTGVSYIEHVPSGGSLEISAT